MGFGDWLKDGYFDLEEKWYRVLDRIDTKIPIYKVIDPIDKVVPSFVVFLILVAILLILGVWLLLGAVLPAATTSFVLTVFDEDGSGLPNIDIEVSYDGVTNFYATDVFGKAIFDAPLGIFMEVEIDEEGFQTARETFEVTDSPEQTEIVTLFPELAAVLTKTIRLVNQAGQPISKAFTLSFDCSNMNVSPPADIFLTPADGGVATVDVPGGCGTLYVSVTNDTTYALISSLAVDVDDKTIYLDRVETEDGTLIINISSQGVGVNGITIEIYKYDDLLANPNIGPVDYSTTTGGQATFTVTPGRYTIKTHDPIGRFGPEQKIGELVGSGDTRTVSINLDESVKGSIEVQVIDKASGQPIDDASVKLLYASDNDFVASKTTNADLNSKVSFNLTREVEYRAVIEAEGYQIVRLSNLFIGSAATTEMEPCTPVTCGSLLVKVVDQDGEAIENATVALYSAASNFLAGYGEKVSDFNGLAKFTGIASANYYAFAFKEGSSGRSDAAYFSSTASDDDTIDLTVTMQVADGTIRAEVLDMDQQEVPFAVINIFNARDNQLIGQDLADGNGVYVRSLKADKRVYLLVEKSGFADYVTTAKPILPSTVQNFEVTMEPEVIEGEARIRFLGLHKGKLLATTLAAGSDYTGRWQLVIPEAKDYSLAGVHLRTGSNLIIEKDSIVIREVGAPNASIVRAAAYDEASGRSEGDYPLTNGDAKWVNLVWQNPGAGIYEIEAGIRVKETASIGEELPVFYRAWAEDGQRLRDPEDTVIESYELYSNTYKDIYQVGVATLCDRDFCFNATITDLREDLITSVTDFYPARIFNDYEFFFTLTNNSKTRIHDNAEIRIRNEDESLLFGTYTIYDAESRPVSGNVGGYEFDRIDVGNLSPSKKVSGTLRFVTQQPINGVINIRLVSDKVVVYEKNITISIAAAKELDVVAAPTTLPSGIENDINVLVKDKGTGVEIEDAIVRVRDKRGDVVAIGTTTDSGLVFLTLPASRPGTSFTVEVEKPNYDTVSIPLEVSGEIVEIKPTTMGVALNIKTKTESEDEFSVRNLTLFPLKITKMELTGNFKNLLDEGAIANWLNAAYRDLVIGPGEKVELALKTYLTEDGKSISERADLTGTIAIEAENFGQKWFFSIPVSIAIGLGAEVEDPGCLVLTRSEWNTMTEGNPVLVEFEIQNNCTIEGRPVDLRNLEAKVEWRSNQIGDFTLTIGNDETELRPNYFRTLSSHVPAEETYFAILKFSPFGGVSGVADADIVIRATNPLEEKDQVLTARMKANISVVNIKDCISFNKTRLEMMEGEQDSFQIATKGCGGQVDFEVKSDLELSIEDFTMQADDSSPEVEVRARDNYPGQYPIYIYAKGASEKQKRLIKTLKARVNTDGCVQLSRYEFDVYDDPDNPYDGVDRATLVNYCLDQQVEVRVDMKDFTDAMKEGLKIGLLTFAAGMVSQQLDGWLGGAGSPARCEEKCVELGCKGGDTRTGDCRCVNYNNQTRFLNNVDEAWCIEGRTYKELGYVSVEKYSNLLSTGDLAAELRKDLPKEVRFRKGELKVDVIGDVVIVTHTYDEDNKKMQEILVYRKEAGEWIGISEPAKEIRAGTASKYDDYLAILEEAYAPEPSILTGFQIFGGSRDSARGSKRSSGGLLGGLGGPGSGMLGGLLGAAGGLWGSIMGTDSPIKQGIRTFLATTMFEYFTQEDEISFRTIRSDREIENIILIIAEAVRDAIDPDVSVTRTEETSVEPLKDNPLLHSKETELVFTNQTGFTTSPEEPHFSILKVSGTRHEYRDKLYEKDEIFGDGEDDGFLGGLFDFGDGFLGFGGDDDEVSEEDIDNAKLDEKDSQPFEQKFHLQFDSIPPEIELPTPTGLLNCQAGTRLGSTGKEALPRVKLAWDWSSIEADECDVGNDDYIYCDATQFSIALLKKIEQIENFLEQNSPFQCPSLVEGFATNTSEIGSLDIGVSRISVERLGTKDVNVMVDIENTNPEEIIFDLNISIENLITGETIGCSSGIIPGSVLSKETYNCRFNGLEEGTYRASASIVPSIDCQGCQDKVASNNLSSSITLGATGLEQCEPYTTQRLDKFLEASGMTGASVEDILDTTNFRAHLIRDRYAADFQRDFDDYSKLESFFQAPSFYTDADTGLGVYFGNPQLFEFSPKFGEANPEGYLLPGPGIYEVNIDIRFEDDSWRLFTSEGPNAKIVVTLNRLDTPEPPSPFYWLPFDGPVGESNGRVGYGVNYRGEEILINEGDEAIRTIEIGGSTPVINGEITVSRSDNYRRMNVDDRGTLMTVTGGSGRPATIDFIPSYATPVIMRITNNADEAWAFYSVGIGGDAINTGSSMSKWNGIGYNCRNFDGRPMIEAFSETADLHGLNTRCAVLSMELQPTTYGFESCENIKTGSIFVKSVFYTPQNRDSLMKLVTANDEAELIGAGIGGNQIPLNGISSIPYNSFGGQGINSVENIFQLVEDEYACISSSESKAEFWWNPKQVYEAIQNREDAALGACITE